MMNRQKIVLIGAGSASFTRGLVADLILSTDLGPWELGLVDIDPEALETAEGLSRRMIEARDVDIPVSASTDRIDILPGADVVVMTVGVGGRRSWEADVQIPRKHGVYQPVGDTVMAGGISRAMRMIPALVDIACDVRDLCPDALFFNYSNPMTANCWAIREAVGIPVTGLCHGTFNVTNQLADFIGAPRNEVSATYAGLNHLTFIYDLRWKGRDAWPLVRARLARDRGQTVDTEHLGQLFPEMGAPSESFNSADNAFSWSIFDAYGAYPAVNDRHVSEFFPERFPAGQYFGKTLGVDVYSLEATTSGGDDRYAAMRVQALGEQPLDEGVFKRTVGEHEQLLSIIASIRSDSQGVYAANVPNLRAVPNLPEDAPVEIPCVATSGGMRPVQLTDFPDTLATIITRKLTATRLTVQAALQGDRNLFTEALLADGCISDRDAADRLRDELLEAQRQYLPNFYANA